MYALEISGLTKTYGNMFQALKGIDLKVEKGDFFALLGPNGAGKSTTISILTHLVNKTQGTVKIYGVDIDKDFSTAKTYLGVVPQEINVSIFEKVIDIVTTQAGYYGIARKEALKEAERVLKQVDLWDRRHSVARMLSGGMKRRLMIARALVHNPKILILDEPTAGVDIEIRRSMWRLMQKLNKDGVTIILTTHYLEEAEQLCKNIAIIDHGKIIENTSMKKLLGTVANETFVLDLAEPLKKKLSLKEVTQIDDMTLEVVVHKKKDLNTLFTELSKKSIIVKSMRNKSNRLEELFVQLVGEKK